MDVKFGGSSLQLTVVLQERRQRLDQLVIAAKKWIQWGGDQLEFGGVTTAEEGTEGTELIELGDTGPGTALHCETGLFESHGDTGEPAGPACSAPGGDPSDAAELRDDVENPS